jgi:hypothetical protein
MRESRLALEMLSDVRDDTLAQPNRVHRDVEELRPQVPDHCQVDLRLEIRKRLA